MSNKDDLSSDAFILKDTPRWIQNTIFICSLLGALTTGDWFWISRIAWGILTILITLDIRYGIFAIVFFASFFHPSGFLDKLFFTIKHFHLAIALTMTVQILRGSIFSIARSAIRQLTPLMPLFVLLGLALFSNVIHNAPWKSYSMALNFAFILISWTYLLALIARHEEVIDRGIFFFILGVATQAVIGLYNIFASKTVLGILLPHNNHLGILFSFSLFYALTVMITGRKQLLRISSLIVFALIFTGMLFSCSRTAWLSFIAGYFFYTILTHRNSQFPESPKCKQKIALSTFICALAIGIGIGTNLSISNRFIEIGKIFNIEYLQYTIQDSQNFGFLGIFRLTQLYDLWRILQASPFIGVGFSRQVVDFHSLYFTFLGATGFIGLFILAFYIRNLIHGLLKAIKECHTMSCMLVRAGTLCALLTWLLSAFMETLVLQYSVWINVLIAAALIQTKEKIKPNAPSKN